MLVIKKCEFQYFYNKYDSLIEVENNNFYMKSDPTEPNSGFLFYYGD